VLAYETLTGTLPFDSEDVVTTLRKHVHERPEPLRERAPDRRVPADVEDLVFKLLTKDPAKRPQSMAEVEALLCEAQIASGLTTTGTISICPTSTTCGAPSSPPACRARGAGARKARARRHGERGAARACSRPSTSGSCTSAWCSCRSR
jgi:serine/threonine protein kinase